MKNYELVDVTADTGIKAWGETFTGLTNNLLCGFYSVAFDFAFSFDKSMPGVGLPNFCISGSNYSDLCYSLIDEAIFSLFVKGEIIYTLNSDKFCLNCIKFENRYYRIETEIKAATKHKYSFEKKDHGFFVFIILDL